MDSFANNTEALHYLQKHISAPASDSAFTDMISSILTDPQSRRALLEELDIKSRMQLLLHSLESESSEG